MIVKIQVKSLTPLTASYLHEYLQCEPSEIYLHLFPANIKIQFEFLRNMNDKNINNRQIFYHFVALRKEALESKEIWKNILKVLMIIIIILLLLLTVQFYYLKSPEILKKA